LHQPLGDYVSISHWCVAVKPPATAKQGKLIAKGKEARAQARASLPLTFG
jgi:hypothetical protein